MLKLEPNNLKHFKIKTDTFKASQNFNLRGAKF
jgi:hypothetical protein